MPGRQQHERDQVLGVYWGEGDSPPESGRLACLYRALRGVEGPAQTCVGPALCTQPAGSGRARAQRAGSQAQPTACYGAAPAGGEVLCTGTAPGDTRGLKTLPPGAQQVTSSSSFKHGTRVYCLWQAVTYRNWGSDPSSAVDSLCGLGWVSVSLSFTICKRGPKTASLT